MATHVLSKVLAGCEEGVHVLDLWNCHEDGGFLLVVLVPVLQEGEA